MRGTLRLRVRRAVADGAVGAEGAAGSGCTFADYDEEEGELKTLQEATVLAFWWLIGAALAACIWLVARKVVNRAR